MAPASSRKKSPGLISVVLPGVPVNYVIDHEGKIAGAVYGYERGHERMLAVLKEVGLKIEGE